DEGGLEGIGNEAIVDISYHSRTENFLVDTKPHLGKVDLPFEMVKSFVKSIMENRVPPITGYESVVLHSIIDAIYKSSEENREVRVTLPD
ncbi:gfo/Idh/MocA family oxidoreductase, partial [Sulfolobus sp. E1]